MGSDKPSLAERRAAHGMAPLSKEARAANLDVNLDDAYAGMDLRGLATDLMRERDSLKAQLAAAQAEVTRFHKLFDDAGQGEHNVLALVDYYIECDHKASTERDAYRSLLADLVAGRRLHALGKPCEMSALWDRARELLKNGPITTATATGASE